MPGPAQREAPAVPPFDIPDPDDPAFPDVANDSDQRHVEEVLNIDNIQGNILAGFNKDFQTLLFYNLDNVKAFKQSLQPLLGRGLISTTREVLRFNRVFKLFHSNGGDPTGLVATWVNLAISAAGLRKLVPDALVQKFEDEAFKVGLALRAEHELDDPVDLAAEGNPRNWVVGGLEAAGKSKPVHLVFIVASDTLPRMNARVEFLKEHVKGVTLIFEELGKNLPAPLSGHEHFKTLDGVSQPGIRGRISDDPHDVLTPRQNPEKVDGQGRRTQGKPGQDVLWPGEFVFGYPAQDPDAETLDDSKGKIRNGGTGKEIEDLTRDGSFLVFRRLRQDVFAFHKFLNDKAKLLSAAPFSSPPDHVQPNQLSAKLVGRWLSGAPVIRTPDVDNQPMGDDDCANNNFEFNPDEPPDHPIPLALGRFDCEESFPDAFTDDSDKTVDPEHATGIHGPFDMHIRKAYPRNDLTVSEQTDASEVDTQTHRILRRGIPFGDVSASTPTQPVDDDPGKHNSRSRGRGLHFLAYQTSIVRQFEFIVKNWVNNPAFSEEAAEGHECPGQKKLPTGHDPVIGQTNKDKRVRRFFVRLNNTGGKDICTQLDTKDDSGKGIDWVIPTGGEYFFCPSISALKSLTA